MSLKIGVVGAGFMGQLHAQTVAESDIAELAAIVDLSEALGQETATRLGTRHIRTVDEALADESIDAYVVALPDRLHGAAAPALLRAGKPVLLEKPMAHNLETAHEIAQAAKDGGARLLVGQILRHDPRYVAAAEAVRAGKIGEPIHVTAGRLANRDIGTRMNGTSSVLFYLGIHDVDAMQWVTGKTIEKVFSRSVSKLMPSLGVESEDAILSVVQLEGGTVGQLFNGWTRTQDDPIGIDGRLEVLGTDGRVEIDVRDHGVRVFGKDGLEMPDALHWPEVNARIRGDLAAESAHFARCVTDGSPFVISVAEAVRDVAVNDAILRSVASGKEEDVTVVGDS